MTSKRLVTLVPEWPLDRDLPAVLLGAETSSVRSTSTVRPGEQFPHTCLFSALYIPPISFKENSFL